MAGVIEGITMIDQILQAAKSRGAKVICIQAPEGLKKQAIEAANALEKEGLTAYLLAEPCYGACDLWDLEAERLGCELIIHIGHSSLGLKTKIPVEFIQYNSPIDVAKVVGMAVKKIPEKKIAVTTTAQHLYQIDHIKRILIDASKDPVLAKPNRRGSSDGQVLGCDPGAAANVDEAVTAFLYIGTGNFHPLEIAIATGKKVYVADPELNQVRVLDKERDKFLKKRFAKIEAAKKAQKFGILLSTKLGQMRRPLAENLVKICKQAGKEAYILASAEISPAKLMAFGVDAYVSTACPRLAIDDSDSYDKPLLTPQELEIVLGVRDWENYKLDAF